jgi:hypothetical protein
MMALTSEPFSSASRGAAFLRIDGALGHYEMAQMDKMQATVGHFGERKSRRERW